MEYPGALRVEDFRVRSSTACRGFAMRAGIVMAEGEPCGYSPRVSADSIMSNETSSLYPSAPVPTSDKALIILSHLSALIGVGFLLPFVVWLIKRRDPDIVA